MAQADQTVQNDTFPTVRADINNNLAALFSNSSGATAPSVTVAHQDWVDTSGADPVWKKRNAANNGWITIGTIKTNTLEFSGDNVLPSQTGNSGEFLTTDGTTASWAQIPAGIPTTVLNTQNFTSSGSWSKPATGTWALVRCWGGGGSGGKGVSGGPAGGGGGGAFVEKMFALSALGSSETVTIGAGGAGQTIGSTSGNPGGTTTFGSHVSAYGGGSGAYSASGGNGGGGGGGGSVGENGASGSTPQGGDDLTNKTSRLWFPLSTVKPETPSTPSAFGYALDVLTVVSSAGANGGLAGVDGENASTFNGNPYGGGGGGGGLDGAGSSGTTNEGGSSVWGGGGGGGAANSVIGGNGGTSTYGGAGSAGTIDSTASSDGSQPGGGSGGTEGGNSGAGGAGQCIVYVY